MISQFVCITTNWEVKIMTTDTPTSRLAYSVNSFCEAVDISRTTFYQLIADGKLKTVKVGNKTLVTADEAQRFIDALKEAAA